MMARFFMKLTICGRRSAPLRFQKSWNSTVVGMRNRNSASPPSRVAKPVRTDRPPRTSTAPARIASECAYGMPCASM